MTVRPVRPEHPRMDEAYFAAPDSISKVNKEKEKNVQPDIPAAPPNQSVAVAAPAADPTESPVGSVAGTNAAAAEKTDASAALGKKAEPASEILARPVRAGDLVDLNNVDTPPILRSSMEPVYPPLAYQNRLQAQVSLSILISEKGDVLDAKVVGNPSVNLGFEKAALKAVRRWTYIPARKEGQVVRVRKPVVIDFRIR